MTASAGLPALRLVRWSIEGLTIEKMESGEIKSIELEQVLSGIFGLKS
jgi:23S rRNA pseudouridine2457 synthase